MQGGTSYIPHMYHNVIAQWQKREELPSPWKSAVGQFQVSLYTGKTKTLCIYGSDSLMVETNTDHILTAMELRFLKRAKLQEINDDRNVLEQNQKCYYPVHSYSHPSETPVWELFHSNEPSINHILGPIFLCQSIKCFPKFTDSCWTQMATQS